MKFLAFVFFLCIISFAHSQPGDIMAMRKAQLQNVEKSLQNDPNNMLLVWERMELVFRPHFDLYKKARTFQGFQDVAAAYPYYILDDLNYLIAAQTAITFKNKQISSANFYLRRGQFYYVTGYPKYALDDYLIALQHNPTLSLKQEICIALAAYYYNLDENYSLENYEKALYYIDLVTPKEDLAKLYVHYNSRQSDRFEREKILLLKASQKTERLVTYLQCIAKKYFQFYQVERGKSEDYQRSHSYTISYSLRLGFDKLYEIAIHFYEKGQYAKAKNNIEQIISLLPRNKYGQYYETYAYGNYFLLLSKIYSTDSYQNIPLEIDNLLEGLGDPTQGFPSQATKYGNRLDELLKLYPNEPKLHLAKAIYLKKISYNGGYKIVSENVFNFLQQSELLGLQDYRIWYVKAMLLNEEKRYEEALQEINNAQLLSSGHVNVYALKMRLLQNIESSAEIEITTTKSLLQESKKKEKVAVYEIIAMIDGM